MTPILDPVTGDTVVDILSFMRPDLLKQQCLNHGFVNLLDCMPRLVPLPAAAGIIPAADFALADAARLSYQKGTRKANSDSGLVDNLIRQQHTSPIEMGELKFHIRLPIFVMRQHVRHRTASLNEESARYSELASDFYIPDPQHWAVNTTANKQATVKADLSTDQVQKLHDWIKEHDEESYRLYQQLLDGSESADGDISIPGIAREQARMVLGVNIYTQCIWKCDLKNLLHYLKLRTDPHAQYEIRVFADAIARVVEFLFPAAWASFKDNFIDGLNFSRFELDVLNLLIANIASDELTKSPGNMIVERGWSKTRFGEFAKKVAKAGFIHETTMEMVRSQVFPPATTVA